MVFTITDTVTLKWKEESRTGYELTPRDQPNLLPIRRFEDELNRDFEVQDAETPAEAEPRSDGATAPANGSGISDPDVGRPHPEKGL